VKSKIRFFVNKFLSFFGISIIKKNDNVFDIDLALERIKNHHFKVKSVIDIGASNGIWSLNIIKKFPELNSVLAIEPLEERKESLLRIAKRVKKFKFSPCIAGEFDNEFKTLNVSNDLDGTTVDGYGGIARNVMTKSIDTLVEENNLVGPFLIKFDTHGYEIPILKGAKRTLLDTDVIIMEVYNFHVSDNAILFPEMCQFLDSLGFRCFDLINPVLRPYDNSFWQADLIFCKKTHQMFDYEHYQ